MSKTGIFFMCALLYFPLSKLGQKPIVVAHPYPLQNMAQNADAEQKEILQDTFSKKNGTYECSNRLHGIDDYYKNHVQIYFLNDSCFLFTIDLNVDSADNSYEADGSILKFNDYRSQCGIARICSSRVLGKGWFGIEDFGGNMYDSSFFSQEKKSNLQEVIKVVHIGNDPRSAELNNYHLIQFMFNKDTLVIEKIDGLGRGFESGAYHLINNKQMTLDVPDNFKAFKTDYGYVGNKLIVKKDAKLSKLPMPDKNVMQNKAMGMLKKSDTVYYVKEYMKYILVAAYNRDKKLNKYGWTVRDNLRFAK